MHYSGIQTTLYTKGPKEANEYWNKIFKIVIVVTSEISGDEEFNYTCNKNEYQFWKKISEEEYNSLDIHSKEHEVGNVLIYANDECYILDGIGFFRISFEPN